MNKPSVFAKALRDEREFLHGPCKHMDWDLARDLCVGCGKTGAAIYAEGDRLNTNYVTYPIDPTTVYGRMVRIPIVDGLKSERSIDVTEREAKRIAKRYRKAAKRIERLID